MKKQGKTIMAGLVVVCVLGGAYMGIRYTKEQSAAKAQAAEEAGRTYLTDMGEVNYISYENDGSLLEFEKEDDIWYYAPDHNINLIQSTLESMAVDVKKIEITRTLEGGEGLEEYGLAEPVNRITIKDTDGASQTVLIGNAAGDDIYACLDGQKTVTVIGSELQNMTEKTLEDLTEVEPESETESDVGESEVSETESNAGESEVDLTESAAEESESDSAATETESTKLE